MIVYAFCFAETVYPASLLQLPYMSFAAGYPMLRSVAETKPIAGTRAMKYDSTYFNLIQYGRTGKTRVLWIYGEESRTFVGEIGMNAGGNALGPGNRANATIGRAISLIVRNIGGATPGEVDMATLGQPAKYTFCLAENEAASPWPALHVERGFPATASVVTVVGAAGIVEVVDSASRKGEDLAQTLAQSMLIAVKPGCQWKTGGCLVIQAICRANNTSGQGIG